MKLFKIPYCKSTNFVYRLRRIIFKFDRSIIYIIYIYKKCMYVLQLCGKYSVIGIIIF